MPVALGGQSRAGSTLPSWATPLSSSIPSPSQLRSAGGATEAPRAVYGNAKG